MWHVFEIMTLGIPDSIRFRSKYENRSSKGCDRQNSTTDFQSFIISAKKTKFGDKFMILSSKIKIRFSIHLAQSQSKENTAS